MGNKNGASLIEMIYTLALLGIISCIAVPCISGLYNKSQEVFLDTGVKELLSDLRLIQQKSRDENTVYHFFFNKANNTYMIYSYADMTNCVYKNKKLPDGISFDSIHSTYKDNKVSFSSRGKALPYPCTISLINKIGQYRKITITVGTDYISLKN